MYEHRTTRPLPIRHFLRRMFGHFLIALALLTLSLFAGMLGYEHFEHLPWRDAFLNTAMLLGGMGPVDDPITNGGKIFEGSFALYAGLVFLLIGGVLLAPLIHRVMHRFHWEESGK